MITAYQTDIGKQRSENQDRVNVYKHDDRILAIIADGIGGNRSGDVAAQLTVKFIGQHFQASAPKNVKHAKKWFIDQVQLANQLVLKKSTESYLYQGMGTTLVAAIIFPNNQLVIANIGDSRGYLFHDQYLTQITNDHSLVNELVKKGDMSERDARLSPQNNIITRAIGVSYDAQADVNAFPFKMGDQLLLCSDGLSKMLSNQEMKTVLANDSLDLGSKCQTLIHMANEAGGPDNVTVLISLNDQERQ